MTNLPPLLLVFFLQIFHGFRLSFHDFYHRIQFVLGEKRQREIRTNKDGQEGERQIIVVRQVAKGNRRESKEIVYPERKTGERETGRPQAIRGPLYPCSADVVSLLLLNQGSNPKLDEDL